MMGIDDERLKNTIKKGRQHLRMPELRAALITGFFTLVGVIIGVYLDRQLMEPQLRRHEVATIIAQRAQGRWTRARVVMFASGSTMFPLRWEDYIQNGFTPWNQDYYVMRIGVERYFPGEKRSFDSLSEEFRKLNIALLPFHRTGGNPPDEARREANEVLDRVGTKTGELIEAIFDDL